jgi:hypothetical protein
VPPLSPKASYGLMPQHPSSQPRHFFKGQVVHFLSLWRLLGLVWLLVVEYDRMSERQLFGWNAKVWFVTYEP